MLNLFVETLTNGYDMGFLLFLSVLAIGLGISIIIAKNPILSVLFLIGLFFSISIYLMMMGLYFIGLSYLLVYVGAVSILFLFILMLINVRISELLTEGRNSIPLAIIAILSFNVSINGILPYCLLAFNVVFNYILNLNNTFYVVIYGQWGGEWFKSVGDKLNVDLLHVSSKSWDTILTEISHITSIGNILYTNLFIYLIVTSLILLLAMIGTIVITIKQKSIN